MTNDTPAASSGGTPEARLEAAALWHDFHYLWGQHSAGTYDRLKEKPRWQKLQYEMEHLLCELEAALARERVLREWIYDQHIVCAFGVRVCPCCERSNKPVTSIRHRYGCFVKALLDRLAAAPAPDAEGRGKP